MDKTSQRQPPAEPQITTTMVGVTADAGFGCDNNNTSESWTAAAEQSILGRSHLIQIDNEVQKKLSCIQLIHFDGFG